MGGNFPKVMPRMGKAQHFPSLQETHGATHCVPGGQGWDEEGMGNNVLCLVL